MRRIDRCLVAGGDERSAELAFCLLQSGIKAFILGLENAPVSDGRAVTVDCGGIPEYDVAFLPFPISKDGKNLFAPFSKTEIPLDLIFSKLIPDRPVFAGRVSPQVGQAAERHKITVNDIFSNERLLIRGAVPTAEGAIQLAMQNTPQTVWDSRVLVTGFGRVSKALCRRLEGLTARPVAVAARRFDVLAEIGCDGYEAVPLNRLSDISERFDIVFNTVPAPIFTGGVIKKMKKDALIIDLASMPGGVDKKAASEHGIKTIHALALPSKAAPRSAAADIMNTAFEILREGSEN